MKQRYEIQGRVVERHKGMIVRDETRRAERESLVAAQEVATTFLADGLMTWIFEVRWEPGQTIPTYTMVDRLRPAEAPSSRRMPTLRVVADRDRGRRAA